MRVSCGQLPDAKPPIGLAPTKRSIFNTDPPSVKAIMHIRSSGEHPVAERALHLAVPWWALES